MVLQVYEDGGMKDVFFCCKVREVMGENICCHLNAMSSFSRY